MHFFYAKGFDLADILLGDFTDKLIQFQGIANVNTGLAILLCGVICLVGSAIVEKLDMLVKINKKD